MSSPAGATATERLRVQLEVEPQPFNDDSMPVVRTTVSLSLSHDGEQLLRLSESGRPS